MIRNFLNQVFTDFWNFKFWILVLPFILVVFIPTMILWLRHEYDTERLVKTNKQEIQQEVERRRAATEKNDTHIAKTPSATSGESTARPTDKTSPGGSTPVTDSPQNSPDPPSGLLPAGPYEGMTLAEAQAFEQREHEYHQRLVELSERFDEALNLYLESADDEYALMLSLLKSLSPEQLKYTREELSKELPAGDVHSFFDDLEKGIDMTEAQITAEAEQILASRKTLDIVYRELAIEREELDQEGKALYGNDE